MNNIEHKQDKIDPAEVKKYAEYLIKTHEGFNPIKSIVLDAQASHASIVTARELAAATAKKFYYEVIQHLENGIKKKEEERNKYR